MDTDRKTYTTSTYKILRPISGFSWMFGETYLIACGINTSGDLYRGEYFVLRSLPTPDLVSKYYSFSAKSVPKEIVNIDEDYIMSQMILFARARVEEDLRTVLAKAQIQGILERGFDFQESQGVTLVGCWMRGLFHEQLRAIQRATECESLSIYLFKIQDIKPLTLRE